MSNISARSKLLLSIERIGDRASRAISSPLSFKATIVIFALFVFGFKRIMDLLYTSFSNICGKSSCVEDSLIAGITSDFLLSMLVTVAFASILPFASIFKYTVFQLAVDLS